MILEFCTSVSGLGIELFRLFCGIFFSVMGLSLSELDMLGICFFPPFNQRHMLNVHQY